jgi:hypothetical protein
VCADASASLAAVDDHLVLATVELRKARNRGWVHAGNAGDRSKRDASRRTAGNVAGLIVRQLGDPRANPHL